MTKEQAIRILSSDTSIEEIHKLKYYAGFNQDRVLEQIQEDSYIKRDCHVIAFEEVS